MPRSPEHVYTFYSRQSFDVRLSNPIYDERWTSLSPRPLSWTAEELVYLQLLWNAPPRVTLTPYRCASRDKEWFHQA